MLASREEMQKILQEEETANWLELCLAAVEGELPEGLRATAYALLNRDEQGKEFDYRVVRDSKAAQRHRELVAHNRELLMGMTSEERSAIFSALVPRIAPTIEAAWQLLGRLPYQTGWGRKAFRIAAGNGVHTMKSVNWVHAIVTSLKSYREKDLAWMAVWAPYIVHYDTQPLGILFATAIDQGGTEGDEVFSLLVEIARGEHAIGKMGRHVTTGLLVAARPEGWDCIERLLLAAQREEGVRQVILETVDEAHPQAFRRMLQLILDHDLLRFSATVRAVDVWLGFGRTVEDIPALRAALRIIVRLLDDPAQRDEDLAHGNPQQAYFALWSIAFTDASEAVAAALPIIQHDPMPERRLAAMYLQALLQLPETRSTFFPLLDEPDLRIAYYAFIAIQYLHRAESQDDHLFEPFRRLLERMSGKKHTIQSGIWPWWEITVQPETVLSKMLQNLGERDPRCLIVYQTQMNSQDRLELAKKFVALPASDWDEEIRGMLYSLMGDRSSRVRAQGLELLSSHPLDEVSMQALEQLLTRKDVELRRGLIALLLKCEDQAVLQSAGRLLTQRAALQRLAGLDLLNGLVVEKRQVEQAVARASLYREQRGELTLEETTLVNTTLEAGRALETWISENVLGLIVPDQRTPVVQPQHRSVIIDTPAARNCLLSLDALIEERQTTPVVVKTWRGKEEMLLGNVHHYFPASTSDLEAEEDERENLPLAELWLTWEHEREAALHDPDGLELYRATLLLRRTRAVKTVRVVDGVLRPSYLLQLMDGQEKDETGREKLVLLHLSLVEKVLAWLQRRRGASNEVTDFLLDATELAFANVDVARIVTEEEASESDSRKYWPYRDRISNDGSLVLLQRYHSWYHTQWLSEYWRRYWQLLHWLDEPVPGLDRRRPPLGVLMEVYQVGEANEADILDQLGGPVKNAYRSRHGQHGDLSALSTRVPPQQLTDYPILKDLVDRLRARILEIELGRGELPTVATDLALSLRYSGGMALFVRLVALLDSPKTLMRYTDDGQGKGATWSHLLRVCHPDASETVEEFARLVEEKHIDAKRLVVAAVYAPQWAHHIEYVLGWPHFADAVWWIYAHTRGINWQVDDETLNMWKAQVAERTIVSSEDLVAGAVDVAWFQNSYAGLGAERWEQVYAAAKYAASGTGHGRARLYADAMSGKISAEELCQRIQGKRQQDAVRALGLVPLPSDAGKQEAAISERYLVFQEFKWGGRQFGAQRRATEEAAMRIGLENLARTAGFPDPQRLQWAMEARTADDLRDGSITLHEDGVQITLSLDDRSAEPHIAIIGNKGKALNAMPARLKKNQNVVALLARKREIEQHVSRMRIALEEAMCRGDLFRGDEVLALLDHPVLVRLLQNLIFVQIESEQEQIRGIAGYPLRCETEIGPQLFLRDHTDRITGIAVATMLRLAHPHDLFLSQEWHAWQRECFAAARAQPFKQIFRELYLRTSNEVRNGDDAISWRYAGQQVQPRQAHALLGQRGWVTDYEGAVHRTFHTERLSVTVSFMRGIFTPSEVEGLTVDQVFFTRQGEYKPMPLESVPPRAFSEAMRDLDLMVSVAHSGGVDPEATASTVEMRTALINETCLLLGLENVVVKSAHALIEGTLGRYSVHIGSGVVHRLPGGALCIIPVHAQHRGRIFLPFADNDPRTAEVISKVIMLARDGEIKDPTILEQIL